MNEEMAEIVNRFESTAESLQLHSHSNNDNNTQNNTLLDQSSAENRMDQSEDDSYYQNSFRSSVGKSNDRFSKRNEGAWNHGDEHDDSNNGDANNENCSKTIKNGIHLTLIL